MLKKELDELQNPMGHTLEHLLVTNKKAALEILRQLDFYFPTNEGFLRHLIRYLWPPFRVFRIFGSCQRLPRSAAKLAEFHRPKARFVIDEHTHYPGIWSRRNHQIINTGSFLPGLGRLLVDIHEKHLEVRKIRRTKGAFHQGRIVRRYEFWTPNYH